MNDLAMKLDTNTASTDSLATLAPRPRTLEETGLSLNFSAELVAKHLYHAGVITLNQLSERTALAGPVLEELVAYLRKEAYVEMLGGIDGGAPRYALTDRGRALALDALSRSGYIGPAPVPLKEYARIVRAQSVHQRLVTRTSMQTAFADLVLQDGLLEQLGPAIHSGRPIFIYGPAGSGKTYIAQHLTRMFDDSILIPHAIVMGEAVIQFYDPVYHHPVSREADPAGLMLAEGHDPRYLRCHRPFVMSGGELTLDMLELSYDPSSKQYQAPLQFKANNGLYLIDDLGRQRVDAVDILNRWIVPMEERRDFLSMGAGGHFPVPFEVVLMFSTNLAPLDLADEAFLRRLGYKIRFTYLNPAEYETIWRQVCKARDIDFNAEILQHLLEEFYKKEQVPMLPCHPRDLIGLALDRVRYQEGGNELTIDDIRASWKSYFIQTSETG